MRTVFMTHIRGRSCASAHRRGARRPSRAPLLGAAHGPAGGLPPRPARGRSRAAHRDVRLPGGRTGRASGSRSSARARATAPRARAGSAVQAASPSAKSSRPCRHQPQVWRGAPERTHRSDPPSRGIVSILATPVCARAARGARAHVGRGDHGRSCRAAAELAPELHREVRHLSVGERRSQAHEGFQRFDPSNTEPLLRLNLEAQSASMVESKVAEVSELLGERVDH